MRNIECWLDATKININTIELNNKIATRGHLHKDGIDFGRKERKSI